MYDMHIFNKTLTDNNFTSGLMPNDVYTSANFKINNIEAPMYINLNCRQQIIFHYKIFETSSTCIESNNN